ncbi:MAG TPA: ankyrin repeat domain-containing protein [Pyrinomonadaceae bacterium]|nr:ankyrin repeat domain-containing protein [Pyrinomonadaceae bacterium]
MKRLDFIELLVTHGADPNSVAFIEVLQIWEPKIIRFFLDHGADFLTGSPFARAFGERIRTAIGPWRECREKHPEAASQLQEQADRALRHFCFKEDLKWVSLLMWAGADPRSSGPTLDEDDDVDGEDPATAFTAAAYSKNVQILKRLKPDAKRDDLDKLLTYAASFGRADGVKYLLELGAKPNDKPNGGSTALAQCLSSSLRFRSFRYWGSSNYYDTPSKASKYSVSETLDTFRLLLEHGALWRPDEAGDLGLVRRNLYECEADVTLELVERLVKHTACTQETIHELLRATAMKKHLIPVVRKLGLLGFDVRTQEQKREENRQKEVSRIWALRHLASRYNREEIYEAIWAEPIQHVAKRYNLSDVGLAKVCRKLNIPRPGRGYWAKKAAGKTIPKRPPLPKLA